MTWLSPGRSKRRSPMGRILPISSPIADALDRRRSAVRRQCVDQEAVGNDAGLTLRSHEEHAGYGLDLRNCWIADRAAGPASRLGDPGKTTLFFLLFRRGRAAPRRRNRTHRRHVVLEVGHPWLQSSRASESVIERPTCLTCPSVDAGGLTHDHRPGIRLAERLIQTLLDPAGLNLRVF